MLADLGGVPADRLTDSAGLAGLLLAAANAAGMSPAHPPVVQLGPRGLSAALVCHGGHVSLHGLPDAGWCFADVAGMGAEANGAGGIGGGGGGRGGATPQRGLDVIIKRLGARHVRTATRPRNPMTQATHPEES